MGPEDLSVVVTGRTEWDVPLVQYLIGLAKQGMVLPGDRARVLVEGTDADLLACGQALRLLQYNVQGRLSGGEPLSDEDVCTMLNLFNPCHAGLAAEMAYLATVWRRLVADPTAALDTPGLGPRPGTEP